MPVIVVFLLLACITLALLFDVWSAERTGRQAQAVPSAAALAAADFPDSSVSQAYLDKNLPGSSRAECLANGDAVTTIACWQVSVGTLLGMTLTRPRYRES